MAASTESYVNLDQSAFQYDYETLRTTGVILAVVMFVAGILIALNLVQWKALSHQRQKFPLKRCKADGAMGRLVIARGNAQMHKVTYRNVEESRTCLTSFCNLSLNADLLLYF
ncbi:FXYD domain-containing ion transport regulator 7-like isoform X1 [Ctenopharyngodon idella]|uniref:FXYD domain-containing ion transport regulator 7-like isoform X1 n=1 Tax=Ctenopharyngodon idella TaxID=7959 RepID=UPI00222FC4AF|nr:FXYD domain-containing ion transport regulator 7-like isoform X1 [Ctenopharyngodon idella]XP_051722652.1 FXYD domain-containing ion transport regulator 7-like isoform X1 [Ctenopharyngodon idella]XP_051722653.1 FXYD domain-containing ion transport regulator 7-like isoform X1 [Ctenopharyngodon idella]XP_051722654.1 FXYD domain-containing ion transport regulator 7-like isoform X1 [Ctenopharyngodon idella]XP_051722656.1 FXYD domain-containing ion transport regulator 7-like isoform X1 [Ctenophary